MDIKSLGHAEQGGCPELGKARVRVFKLVFNIDKLGIVSHELDSFSLRINCDEQRVIRSEIKRKRGSEPGCMVRSLFIHVCCFG